MGKTVEKPTPILRFSGAQDAQAFRYVLGAMDDFEKDELGGDFLVVVANKRCEIIIRRGKKGEYDE